MYTPRRITLFIAALFNFACSILSLIALFKVFPTFAMLYFFVSLPITLYALLAKPNKVLDYNLADWTTQFAEEKLESNPF